MAGPLAGYRILEMGGIGPAPFAAMMLADLGAEVIRVDPAREVSSRPKPSSPFVLLRGRRNVALDLKHFEGVVTLLELVARADGLIEGFRPGVMERLGLGPDVCLQRNPKLVFGRMTGWGQTGPLAHAPGHDINYIALAGALAHFGRDVGGPVPPLNVLGDFAGGGMFLVVGMLAALLETAKSGRGQVVDAAMVDGTAVLMTLFWALNHTGTFDPSRRGANLVDTGAHFYDTYRCADGGFISVGSIEPEFYSELLRLTGLSEDPDFADQMDQGSWPQLKARLAAIFETKSRDQWCEIMEGSDVCFAPVLSIDEAPRHPHNAQRATFVDFDGIAQPAPAPRFSRTTTQITRAPAFRGTHTREVLADWGLSHQRIDDLFTSGAAAGC